MMAAKVATQPTQMSKKIEHSLISMEIQRSHYVLSLIEGVVSINVSSRPNKDNRIGTNEMEKI